jgi:hypothetical protein
MTKKEVVRRHPRLYSVRFWSWLDRLLADPDPYAEPFGDVPYFGGRK